MNDETIVNSSNYNKFLSRIPVIDNSPKTTLIERIIYKKKNILDLQFQKYLIIASTSVIIAFSYAIGVSIAIFSKQIRLDDFNSMGAVFVISVGVLGVCSIIFFNAIFHLKNILLVLRSL